MQAGSGTTLIVRGIAAAPGLAVGRARVRRRTELTVERRTLEPAAVAEELQRLRAAVDRTKQAIHRLRDDTVKRVGEEEARIFDAHLAFLDDPAYVGAMEAKVRDERLTAEAACDEVTRATRAMLESLPDEYLRARADDIQDVGRRILSELFGYAEDSEDVAAGQILVAEEVAPSDLAHTCPAALVSARGSKTAHAAIMARTLGIPAVFGLQDELFKIQDGDLLVVNGHTGELWIRPDESTAQRFREQAEREAREREELRQTAAVPAVTRDGQRIQVFANIGRLEDVEPALEQGAEGIGLFRTEFLYLEGDHWPTEDEQYDAYRKVLEAFGDRPVVIRTLDIGGDKPLPYADLPREENPFLGHRGLRFCLAEHGVFRTQLRALLRASAYGTLWVMFPMVTTVDEVRAAKALLEQCRAELIAEGVQVAEHIPVGVMIETPAAAVTADCIAPEVDFFSIGTNDLTQYTMAADRGNERVAHLYQSHHPAVLRLIRMVCEAAARAGIPVGVCGELAGDDRFTEALVGLGVGELSMGSASIPWVKRAVRAIDTAEAQEKVESLLRLPTAEAVERSVIQERQEV